MKTCQIPHRIEFLHVLVEAGAHINLSDKVYARGPVQEVVIKVIS